MSEQQQQQQSIVHAALAWALWTAYPVWLLLLAVWFLLRQLYRPLAYLFLPLTYLARFLAACTSLPFTAAAKLETIYIFLGVAALVGLFGGLFIRSIYAFLHTLLRLDAQPPPPPKLRTAKQYREEKQRQKLHVDLPLSSRHLSPGPLSPGSLSLSDGAVRQGKHRQPLSAQTIIEDDSEF